jgi:DNA-directed RNA polymerase specialized sigma24 family protein
MTGDAGAYRQLLVSLAPHVRAVARFRCRSLGTPEDEVEDLVQEVLLTIHLKRGTWDQSRPIGPWVAAITRNRLIDIPRRRGRHVTVPIEDFVDSLWAEDPTPALSTRDTDSLLGRLKPQQREIVQSISLQRQQHPRDRRPTPHHRRCRPRYAASCAESAGHFLSEQRRT